MLYPGQRVGEFVLERRLGTGASGEMWLAHHHAWADRRVAVKVPTDDAYLRALQSGGRRVHLLDHPGIAAAVAFDPFGQPPYLATEYVPGQSLRALIDRGPLSVADALSVLRRVLLALEHAHGRGLVHGGLKPENVLIDERIAGDGLDRPGAVKLTDFGPGDFADASSSDGSIALSTSLHGERAAQWAANLEYASPEQRRGEVVDGRADLYACGVLFYEMLTASRPVGVELPSEIRPDVPAECDAIFRRAYARLERRFESARQFLNMLATPRCEAAPPPAQPQESFEHSYAAWLERIADEANACRKVVLRGGVSTAFLELAVSERLDDWQRAADAGFAEAQWLLGQCCEQGLGAEWDLHRAARLYRTAAVQDYPPAMNSLGYLYLNGRGVDRNPRVGWRWYERAARMGYAPSRLRLEHLGLLARHGRGAGK
jgi:serine/threonine protein kinase